MYRKILIAHDGSEGAQKAFDAAVELASRLQAQLHMISVEEDLPCHTQTIGEVREEKDLEDNYFMELTAQSKRRAALRGIVLECTIRGVDMNTTDRKHRRWLGLEPQFQLAQA